MTIDKAIEILQKRSTTRPLLGPYEVYGAIKLALEALNFIQRLRSDKHCSPLKRLKGETEG